MSVDNDSKDQILQQATKIRDGMKTTLLYSSFSTYHSRWEVSSRFLSDVNLLNQLYGLLIGRIKARHLELDELRSMDDYITQCFVKLLESADADFSFKLVNIAIGKIFELFSYINVIESIPPEQKVSKASYDKLEREKEELEKTNKFLVKYKGLPELHTLMEESNKSGISIDENWVLALCASNLIEAVVNKKLEALNEKIEGSFKQKYKKLCSVIKEKEGKKISQLHPLALYDGIRNKLDHASDSNRVTSKEAKDISKIVIEFMEEVFE